MDKKVTQTFSAVTAVLMVLFLLPQLAAAQYGPPAGYENMMPSGSGSGTQYGPPAGYENMMPPTGTAPSNMMPSNFGPPANVQDKMNQGLKSLQKGSQGMQKAVDQMRKAIKGATDAGYPPEASVIKATDDGQAAVDVIKKATALDDTVSKAIDDFNAFADVLDANVGPLNMLKNFKRITKQADSELAKLDANFAKVKKSLEKITFDLTAQYADIDKRISDLKKVYDNAKALAKKGDGEGAFNALENDFFPGIADINQSIGMLQAVKNLSRAAAQVDRGILTADRIVKKIKSAGEKTADLSAIVDKSKAKSNDFKTLLKAKNFSPETATDILDELDGLRADFEGKMETLYDQNSDNAKLGKMPAAPAFFTAPAVTIPNEFKGNTKGGVEKIDSGDYGF